MANYKILHTLNVPTLSSFGFTCSHVNINNPKFLNLVHTTQLPTLACRIYLFLSM